MQASSNPFQKAGDILIRCFILSMGLLIIWGLFYLVGGQWAYDFHAGMFDISKSQFDLINYCGMGIVKFVAFVLFLIPYVAIRMVHHKKV